MSAEIRRRAALNAFQRAREAGQSVEQDDRFHAWIEEWITGRIAMSEVSMRYRALLRERFALRHVQSNGSAVENIQDVSEPEANQAFDLETEINQLMVEDPQASKE